MKRALWIGAVALLCAGCTTEEVVEPTPSPEEGTVGEPELPESRQVPPIEAGVPGGENEPEPEPMGLREVFPGVRLDREQRLVEFDGRVPIDVHEHEQTLVFLEVVVCTPDTKEHEALVVTDALPSHVHAALLAAGFESGTPGDWEWDGQTITTIPPTGDRLSIAFTYENVAGEIVTAPANEWIVNVDTNERLPTPEWIFAGSRIVEWEGQEFYDADGTGTLVGLATFRSETVALHQVLSPQEEMQEPEWIASRDLVPAMWTPVTVRISAASE